MEAGYIPGVHWAYDWEGIGGETVYPGLAAPPSGTPCAPQSAPVDVFHGDCLEGDVRGFAGVSAFCDGSDVFLRLPTRLFEGYVGELAQPECCDLFADADLLIEVDDQFPVLQCGQGVEAVAGGAVREAPGLFDPLFEK